MKKLDYKWIALSNTTLGMLIATINASILLIALPDIFRGIGIDPLAPGNTSYLLWLILGFMVVMAVLLVSLGRLGDIYGRVRMFNLGFAVFTAFSILLSITWMHGSAAAIWLILMRVGQGVGASLLFANSSAILTDAFPADQRGLAMGVNSIAAIAGSFLGLVLGGVLAPVSWRLIFLVSVPPGAVGTVWSYRRLREIGTRRGASVDWAGNITFAVGLVLVMVGITYGIRPHGGDPMGWSSPFVIGALSVGVALLLAFVIVERRVAQPMFELGLFRIRAYTAGAVATFLSSVSRGGLMFMLIIWLQGIWLPRHGYDFTSTPFHAAIAMLPLTFGFLAAGPVSGFLSDRYGSRGFATTGMLGSAVSFVLLERLPVNFAYAEFAGILLLMGLSMGCFAAPNRAAVMNSLPAAHRGAGGGMNQTFQNSAQVLSIGIFFTLMIVGLSSRLPQTLDAGLVAHGVPAATAAHVSQLPPVSVLFAAFLGYNPVKTLVGPDVLSHVSAANAAALQGRSFFPSLIEGPFRTGLHEAFAFAICACLVAAAASWVRGAPARAAVEPSTPEPDEYAGLAD